MHIFSAQRNGQPQGFFESAAFSRNIVSLNLIPSFHNLLRSFFAETFTNSGIKMSSYICLAEFD
jgi:hypothetical protein